MIRQIDRIGEPAVGSSYTEFQGQGFWTSDTGLSVWLRLLAREADRLGECPGWLLEARDYWATVDDWAGVGCIDANLDRFLIDQGRVDLVASLVERSLEFLAEQGPVLARDFLNELISAGPGFHFVGDPETEVFARVGRTLLMLLGGELKTGAETSPVV